MSEYPRKIIEIIQIMLKNVGFFFFGNKILIVALFVYLITFTARDNHVRYAK